MTWRPTVGREGLGRTIRNAWCNRGPDDLSLSYEAEIFPRRFAATRMKRKSPILKRLLVMFTGATLLLVLAVPHEVSHVAAAGRIQVVAGVPLAQDLWVTGPTSLPINTQGAFVYHWALGSLHGGETQYVHFY